ncbi:uncharacterized protein LOC142814527 isoform X2 [Rhipicephalus microplus]|uniref:uncharacterized protein LOC142814527 isoform X2 n=1 Tax=Rhipicephalus microplus TaxID=6941 RepID=UPI003F6C6C51
MDLSLSTAKQNRTVPFLSLAVIARGLMGPEALKSGVGLQKMDSEVENEAINIRSVQQPVRALQVSTFAASSEQ